MDNIFTLKDDEEHLEKLNLDDLYEKKRLDDLIYLEDVEELGFFQRLIAIIWNWIKSLFG